tara:strand:+ start:1733 stop:1864 length:132 start_codon:yes stop_codon:yes gene_type:complete
MFYERGEAFFETTDGRAIGVTKDKTFLRWVFSQVINAQLANAI